MPDRPSAPVKLMPALDRETFESLPPRQREYEIYRASFQNGTGADSMLMQATAEGTVKTQSGSVPAGSRGVIFIISSDFLGSILGMPFDGSVDTSFRLPAPAGAVLNEIPYTIDNGTLRIADVR